MSLKITDVQVFLTQPQGPNARLIVVRVLTDSPNLQGLGCATFTQRHRAVEAAIKHHLRPFVLGKEAQKIEDLWQSMMYSGYWRNGPVLNNAISGIDMALWDIKGKIAGLPCYQLWGGKCRESVSIYGHAAGPTLQDVTEKAKAFLNAGVRHIRCFYSGHTESPPEPPSSAFAGAYYDPREQLRSAPLLFEHLRKTLGPKVELLYDVHERIEPLDAIALAKALEPCRLFFLEDVVSPEQMEWLAMLRQHSAIPIAMGELFNNVQEITPFVTRRLFDFLRVHPSQMGGITPCLKLAHLCAAFGIRTAWHGPPDISPIGLAANVHMDLAVHNFGIQEWFPRNAVEEKMFPGCPRVENGSVAANDKPGLGVEFDEAMAAKYPCDEKDLGWTTARWPDGTIWSP